MKLSYQPVSQFRHQKEVIYVAVLLRCFFGAGFVHNPSSHLSFHFFSNSNDTKKKEKEEEEEEAKRLLQLMSHSIAN
uniref:Uncharacterized protein n=1 Tax=Caenorhabditis japonica TaxID=281687 RepID=A0A8R1ELN3_CAEJA